MFSRLIGKGIDDENSQMVEPFQGTTVGDQLQLGCGTSLASSEALDLVSGSVIDRKLFSKRETDSCGL